MSVTHAWVGAVTHDAFTVVAKVTGGSAVLYYSTDPDLDSPTITGSQTPILGIVKFRVTGVVSGTKYYWGVHDGTLDANWRGQATPFPAPATEASFQFAASSCAGLVTGSAGETITSQVSNHSVFDRVRESGSLFFAHLGDLHYRNISTSDETAFRTAFDNVLTYNGTGASARQGKLYRNTPLVYAWDDHDFGNNNSDSTSATRSVANLVYRERVPSYALPDDEGIYQAFEVGRILFILSDTRTYRTPNTAVDDADKTMLGVQQKDWMRQTLVGSEAEMLVWLLPTPWTGTGNDKWAGFTTERNELALMFTSTGWADRMVCITGDRHALAIDSGGGNPYGGFPIYMCGSLDSGGTGVDPQYDLGMSAGNNRWGKFEVTDSGTEISIKGSGMIGAAVWRSFTFTVRIDQDPIPDDVIPGPTDPRETSIVQWYAFDLVSGKLIDELPDLSGSIGRTLGAVTSGSLSMPMIPSGQGSRRDILSSTQPGQVLIVAVVNDRPTWGGTVLTREGGTGGILQLGVATLEGYLARRYVRDIGPYTDMDQVNVVARNLLLQSRSIFGVGSGINLLIDAPVSGTLMSFDQVLTTDHKKVYDAMTELMDTEGGPEWTIDLEWANTAQTEVAKIARVRDRIGTAYERPKAVFETEAECNATYAFREDFSDGMGANYVTAYSSGQDSSQPLSEDTFDEDVLSLGRPIYEHHFQPSANVVDTNILNANARAELDRLKFGSNTWDITVRWDVYPRINMHWSLGDDVKWILKGHRHPDGVEGVGRLIGWELDTVQGSMKLTAVES